MKFNCLDVLVPRGGMLPDDCFQRLASGGTRGGLRRASSLKVPISTLLTKSHSEFLFKEQKDALWLASPVQVYLDLLRGDGRSRDMAEHLRKEILGI
ncbi:MULTISPECIES: hypothetical protein [unclassified Mesorhizobium]|uniref:hypothetical protein n=1 Tax=unclassified Mesorhizobium TaxID=325217 RepID=UPI00333ADC1C